MCGIPVAMLTGSSVSESQVGHNVWKSHVVMLVVDSLSVTSSVTSIQTTEAVPTTLAARLMGPQCLAKWINERVMHELNK